MLYSHKFPPINLHIFESLFCASSVLGIEDLEMFKTLSLPAESSQTGKRQVCCSAWDVIKEALRFMVAGRVPNVDLDGGLDHRGDAFNKSCIKVGEQKMKVTWHFGQKVKAQRQEKQVTVRNL